MRNVETPSYLFPFVSALCMYLYTYFLIAHNRAIRSFHPRQFYATRIDPPKASIILIFTRDFFFLGGGGEGGWFSPSVSATVLLERMDIRPCFILRGTLLDFPAVSFKQITSGIGGLYLSLSEAVISKTNNFLGCVQDLRCGPICPLLLLPILENHPMPVSNLCKYREDAR